MAITSFSARKITPNIRLLLWPAASLLILFILFVLLLQNALPQVNSKLSSLNESRSEEKALEAKLTSLKGITPSLLDYTNTALSALPDKDSSLWLVSSIRSQTQGQSTVLVKYDLKKEGVDAKTGINSTSLEVNLSSDNLLTTIGLLKAIETMDPVNNFDNILISVSQNVFLTDAKIHIYWSSLPTQFGNVDQPITTLSDQDNAMIAKLQGYTKPDFTSITTENSGGRDNPFQ